MEWRLRFSRSKSSFSKPNAQKSTGAKSGDFAVYGEGCMSIQMVRRWRSWFLERRQNVHDDERSGRPVTLRTM
ncbi:hypothetical protein LAZ67_8003301 [Cordylochernes scorpioides]|uniref:Uncharacterized protein n=1 Tax=Cordylochernes scorpioides TaxID=51811 RepID=A0ABY6KRH9_9ARAC|nr:hypothetical protein LAZ67_8003301 [Cordylochernes scorpioides]